MYYDVLAKRVRHFKETEGGNKHMCKLFEDMRNEAAEKAAKEAAITASIDTAHFYGIDDEKILGDIMKRFGLTERVAKDYLLKVIA